MAKYKNISEQDLYIPALGEVKAGECIETEEVLNNANLQVVVEEKKSSNKLNKEN